MNVDIVGEDDVTKAVLKRLIGEYRKDIRIDKMFPVRGGQIKSLAPKYNLLNTPIFLLTDLDDYPCPISLLHDWFGDNSINPNFVFRIACDEAESWLMADRFGFSKWIEADVNLIPTPSVIDPRRNITELVFPYKPSLYLMREIAFHSRNPDLKNGLTPKEGAKKGPLYNSFLLPFIERKWNVDEASKNSTSLAKAIQRVTYFRETA